MKSAIALSGFLCFMSVATLAAEQFQGVVINHCEKALTAETPALSPEVVQALEGYPNLTREWFYKFVRDFTAPSYTDLLDLALEGDQVTFLRVNDLPLTFQGFGGGLYVVTEVDYARLVGQAIVGYTDEVKERLVVDGKHGDTRMERHYFAGRIESFFREERDMSVPGDRHKNIRHYDGFMILTPANEIRKIEFMRTNQPEPEAHFYILAPKMAEEQIVRQSMKASELEGLVEKAFGAPVTKEDYDMAWAVVETMLSVPPSYGATAVMKILLGRKVRGGDSYPHFGLARGKKRYSEAALTNFISPLNAYAGFARIFGAPVELERSEDTKKNAPEWVGIRYKTPRAEIFRQVWKEIVDAKGGGSREIIPVKERPAGSVKVTSSVLLPGTQLVVKEKVANMSPGQDSLVLTVSGQYNRDGVITETFGVSSFEQVEDSF